MVKLYLTGKIEFRFFYSSIRRHTIYIGDWSSDVCSSDLYCTKPRYIASWPAGGPARDVPGLRAVPGAGGQRRGAFLHPPFVPDGGRPRLGLHGVRRPALGDRKSVV